ncbi:RNA 2',3'-cyclic phosphodiesterase [bacterium]|nr:RNA 2',3'-cyclic phosphodiesterase [bacterium]
MRTFIAIDLDEEIKKNLNQFIKKLDKGNPSIKWVKKNGMHLTLKFLGNVSPEKVTSIQSSLNKAAQEFSSFSLNLKGTGSFPPGKKIPRVLWVGIEEKEPVQSLQARIEEEMEKLHFPKEKRKFHSHLTLGRIKKKSNLDFVLREFHQYEEADFGKMKVEKLTFFQSTLKPSGAEYTVLSVHPLK